MPDEAGFALFMGSFALAEGETLAGALEAFDSARETYLADVRSADPGAVVLSPPAPWDGIFAPIESVERFALVHHIEEFARHAGHADIIREQLDGADAASLLMAVGAARATTSSSRGRRRRARWTSPTGRGRVRRQQFSGTTRACDA